MPKVEFKRKAQLSRQEVAERLIALGNALAGGSEIELDSGDDSLKLGVASRLNWELEIEIDGDETELEIEITWIDEPKTSSRTRGAAAAGPEVEPAATPETVAGEPVQAPARRGRPRKAVTG